MLSRSSIAGAAHVMVEQRRLLVLGGRTLRVVDFSGHVLDSLDLPFAAEELLSCAGSALAIRTSEGIVVFDLDLRREILTVGAPRSALAVVVREQLLCARSGCEIEAFDIATGRKCWTVQCETFRFASFVPLDEPGVLVAVGHFAGETKDSLAMVDLAIAAARPDDVFAQFRSKRGVTDYAYRLAAGPAGRDAFVAFRAPEDDEADDDVMNGLAGLYIRRTDGAVLHQIPWRGEGKIGHVSAGQRSIAVDCGDRVERIEMDGSVRSEPGRWLAASREGHRVLVATATDWRVLEL